MDEPHDPVLAFIRLRWSVDHELPRVSKRVVGSMGLTAPQRLAQAAAVMRRVAGALAAK